MLPSPLAEPTAAAVERCQRPRAVRPPLIWPCSIVPQVPPEFVPARCTLPSTHNTPLVASSISGTTGYLVAIIQRNVFARPLSLLKADQ